MLWHDEVVFVPVDAIKDTYTLEQTDDDAVKEYLKWLEQDIPTRGLQHAIKVTESKRKGEYDNISGKKRRYVVGVLHRKGVAIRYKGHLIPKGKIPVELSKLKGVDAALEALCDNADKMRQLTPMEIGKHMLEKVLRGIQEKTPQHEAAILRASQVFHKNKATIYEYIHAYKGTIPKVRDDKTLTATQKQHLSHLTPEYQEIGAVLVRGKDSDSTETTVNTLKDMQDSGIPPAPIEEAQKKVAAMQKISQRLANPSTSAVNWAKSSLFRDTFEMQVLSLKRPSCKYRTTYLSCPRPKLCKEPCSQKAVDIPIADCKADISASAEAKFFYAALEKELKNKPVEQIESVAAAST